MFNPEAVRKLENECESLFVKLFSLQCQIREQLATYADGKNLKGNELVGWLGEIYGKLLLNGRLVDDRNEHDFVSCDWSRVSVKTRKGRSSGWRRTSAIPTINGNDCPTHLLFVHLNDDYSIDRMWLFDWQIILAANRFKEHVVREEHRSFIFTIEEKKDEKFIVYPTMMRDRTA